MVEINNGLRSFFLQRKENGKHTSMTLIAGGLVVVLLGGCGTGSITTPEQDITSPTPLQVRTINLFPRPDYFYDSFLTTTLGATLQTTAECRVGGQVVSCSPWWFTDNSNAISVNARTGLVRFIGIAASLPHVCVQWSQSESSPRNCVAFAIRH